MVGARKVTDKGENRPFFRKGPPVLAKIPRFHLLKAGINGEYSRNAILSLQGEAKPAGGLAYYILNAGSGLFILCRPFSVVKPLPECPHPLPLRRQRLCPTRGRMSRRSLPETVAPHPFEWYFCHFYPRCSCPYLSRRHYWCHRFFRGLRCILPAPSSLPCTQGSYSQM